MLLSADTCEGAPRRQKRSRGQTAMLLEHGCSRGVVLPSSKHANASYKHTYHGTHFLKACMNTTRRKEGKRVRRACVRATCNSEFYTAFRRKYRRTSSWRASKRSRRGRRTRDEKTAAKTPADVTTERGSRRRRKRRRRSRSPCLGRKQRSSTASLSVLSGMVHIYVRRRCCLLGCGGKLGQ